VARARKHPHRGRLARGLTQLLHAGARRTLGVLDAELHLRVVALPALADAVVGGIALLHLHLLLLADDVTVPALLQVVPVLRVVQIRAGLTDRLPVPGAVLCHEGPRWALLAGELLAGHSIFPLVSGLGAAAELSEEEEERGKHPLRQRQRALSSSSRRGRSSRRGCCATEFLTLADPRGSSPTSRSPQAQSSGGTGDRRPPPTSLPGDNTPFPNAASPARFVVPPQPLCLLSVLKAAPARSPPLSTPVTPPPSGVRPPQIKKQQGSFPS